MKKLILKKAFSQTTDQDTSNNQDNFVKETQMSETSVSTTLHTYDINQIY